MPLASCLYECEIAHARSKPRAHRFSLKHFMMYLDLDEVEQLSECSRLFGTHWFSPYRFDQSDHLPNVQTANSLPDRVRNLVREAGVEKPLQHIRLLTNVRFLGYVFNPVSFFFCFDAAGEAVCCLVEVGNTFGEKKAYLLTAGIEGRFRDRQRKLFYISPFTELTQDLVFDVTMPDEQMNIRVDTMDGQEQVVATSMRGKQMSFSDANLLALTLRYPWAPARVIALIHMHALLLWLKQTPHHNKEENPDLQVEVMNPRSSLKRLEKVK